MTPRSGFTLIEILVVISIMAILAGLVALNVAERPAEARIAAAKVQIKTLNTALVVYKTEQGRYPTLAQGLAALVEKPAVPPVPKRYPEFGYLEGNKVPLDPWNRPYLYVIPGRSGAPLEIISYGADGEAGGTGEDADISSAEL
jgi:general secretion pathway protein G